MPVICAPLQRPQVPLDLLESFKKGNLADNHSQGREVVVDILVGLDYYWRFIEGGVIKLHGGLVAQQSMFGWVLSGSWGEGKGPSTDHSIQLLCLSDIPDSTIRNFWELESIGISPIDKGEVVETHPVMVRFKESVKYRDGRYEVALPWKQSSVVSKLVNNERMVRSCLNSLQRKLSQDPELQFRYNEAFR